MTPSSCVLMAEYNRWMNGRLYASAATLPEQRVFEDRGAFFGSLFDTLNHIAVADAIWLRRFAHHPGHGWLGHAMEAFPNPSSLRQRLAQSLQELSACRERLDQVIIDFAAQVTEGQLAGTLSYANTAGQAQARRFGSLVQHFFNHQTHHRGQATTLMFQMGADVGVTDLLAVIPNEA